jgi:Cyclin
MNSRTKPRTIEQQKEAIDHVAGLLSREFLYIQSRDTRKDVQRNPVQTLPKIHAQWRPTIFEWFYKIIDHFLLEREIVAIAMDYVDRFLSHPTSNVESMSLDMYQLVAMTALYVAMKLHGGNDPGSLTSPWKVRRKTFCVKGFVKLSRGQFIADDILTMETVLFQALGWKMNPVSVICCMDSYMKLMPKPDEMYSGSVMIMKRLRLGQHVLYELSRYLVELAICINGITPYFETDHSGRFVNSLAPSTVAYAGILLAMDMMTTSAITSETRQIFHQRLVEAQHEMITREDAFTSSADSYMLFDPNQMEVLNIKELIHKNFMPSLVLGSLSQSDDEAAFHPFKVAEAAGMFNHLFFKKEVPNIQPSSPTSPLEEMM